MNILDKLAAVPGMPAVKKGFLPDKPDALVALFEYSSVPPEQSFGGTDFIYSVQARIRNTNAATAYATAKAVANTLNRYHDAEISVLQSSPVLDIGLDSANPQRQEYTVNFTVRRY